MSAIIRWILICVGFILVALAFMAAWPLQRAAGGEAGTAFVLAANPIVAAVAVLAAMLVGSIIAVSLARLVTPMTGLAVLGAGMAWAAMDLGTIRPVIASGDAGLLAVDGMVWTIAVLLVSWMALCTSHPMRHMKFSWGEFINFVPMRQVEVHQPADGPIDPLRSPEALRVLALGLAAIPIVWLIAASEFRGQTILATTLGAYGSAMLVRFVAPGVTPVLLPVGVVLAGTLAGWVSGVFELPEAVASIWAKGQVPRLILPLPIDWAAGALLGTAVGYGAFWSIDEAEANAPRAAAG